jgi:hypothetical protein
VSAGATLLTQSALSDAIAGSIPSMVLGSTCAKAVWHAHTHMVSIAMVVVVVVGRRTRPVCRYNTHTTAFHHAHFVLAPLCPPPSALALLCV